MVCIRKLAYDLSSFLPFQKTKVASGSVLKDKLDPELDPLEVMYKLLSLLVYAEAWSPWPIS